MDGKRVDKVLAGQARRSVPQAGSEITGTDLG
jgi:hypothetical protein